MFVEERKLAGGERGRWVGVVEGKRDGEGEDRCVGDVG